MTMTVIPVPGMVVIGEQISSLEKVLTIFIRERFPIQQRFYSLHSIFYSLINTSLSLLKCRSRSPDFFKTRWQAPHTTSTQANICTANTPPNNCTRHVDRTLDGKRHRDVSPPEDGDYPGDVSCLTEGECKIQCLSQ